jgi:hypothetical protein
MGRAYEGHCKSAATESFSLWILCPPTGVQERLLGISKRGVAQLVEGVFHQETFGLFSSFKSTPCLWLADLCYDSAPGETLLPAKRHRATRPANPIQSLLSGQKGL